MRRILLSAALAVRCPLGNRRAGRRLVSLCILILSGTVLWAQQAITGVVKAGEAPLADATVTVEGRKLSAKTNSAGEFSINAPAGSTLLFTHVGYAPKKVLVPNNGNMMVQLEQTSEGLGDVVVVGYGTTKKADLISSVGSISGKELTTFKDPNAANSLQGEVPGVRVLSGSNGPGAQPNIYIRGVYTIQGTSQPLLIVDGVPIQSGFFNSINPADIERMDVLKDASAAAIYGAQAASGVIVITTKKRQGRHK